MKTKQGERINLIESGRVNFKRTNEFKEKVDEIKSELTDQYSLTILNEKNWVKRLVIKIRLQIDIRKRIEKLSSLRNLHIVNHRQLRLNKWGQ